MNIITLLWNKNLQQGWKHVWRTYCIEHNINQVQAVANVHKSPHTWRHTRGDDGDVPGWG